MPVAEKIAGFIERSSWIRAMFEAGAKLKAEKGEENVYDFSLGNPNLDPPAAFYQVMELSQAPVIASHSSCRHFTPGWERNMSDDMIKQLAEKGGVIQINFGSSFLDDNYRKVEAGMWQYIQEHHLEYGSDEAKTFMKTYRREHNLGYADVTDVVAHIDHVVQLVGVDHVGLGSDFDGVGDSLPYGLKDVSYYPNLIYELLKKGYSDADIEKICSGNILRVWAEVDNFAKVSRTSN